MGAFPFPPGIFKDPKDQAIKGFYVDILSEVASNENWRMEYVYGTWEDGLNWIRADRVDVLTSVARTPEREEFLDFAAEPLLTVWGEVYVPAGSALDSIRDLAGRRIAVMRSDYNAQYLRRLLKTELGYTNTFVELGDFEQVFRALEKGEADAGVVNSVFGAARQRDFKVKDTGVVLNPFDIYFAVAKGRNKDILEALDRSLVRWRADEQSVYHRARKAWSHGSASAVRVVPPWFRTILYSFGAVLALSVLFILLLRRQVDRATRDLQRSEAEFRSLVQTAEVVILRVDPEGRIQFINRFGGELFGFAPQELVGREALGTIVPNQETQGRNLQEMLARILERPEDFSHNLNENVTRDGRRLLVSWTNTAIRDSTGQIVEMLSVGIDVTARLRAEDERREMERRLMHAQKLESLGVLAGGIAHDFNNLLTAMQGNIELALADLPHHSSAVESLQESMAANRRAAGLVRQMLAYSGRGRFEIVPVRLDVMVHEIVSLLKVTLSKGARLSLELDPTAPPVLADVNQLQQVVMNLITNASEALGGREGDIRLRTGVRACDEATLAASRLEMKPPAGLFDFIEVSDTGCGMTPEVQDRLFDPFFTTKFTGRGLGMSAVLGVVRSHRGAILVSSAPGQGTCIEVLLPAGPSSIPFQPSDPPRETAAKPAQPMTGTVLVVDDEAPVRRLAERILSRAGLRVATAADGLAAIEFVRAHPAEVACVVLDLTMPGMDGASTRAELAKLRPELPVILASGFDEHEVGLRFDGQGIAAVLQKPYALDQLVRVVTRVLRESRRTG